MSWGEDLWDQYNAVLVHTKKETEELELVLSKFVKERGDIEKEYAKRLRRLVEKFKPKDKCKDEETSIVRSFRMLLNEVGFQAGQHEILSESLSKTIYQQIVIKRKSMEEMISKYKKEAKKLNEELEKSIKLLDRSKHKYRRAYIEWETTNNTFNTAEPTGQSSPYDVAKLRSLINSKQHISDDCKGQYAQQLLKTNQLQERFYYTDFPAVLNNFQKLDMSRVTYNKEILSNCLAEEKSIQPIVSKCYESMESAIAIIDPTMDSNLIIDRIKTGNVPPPDYSFEEMGALGVVETNRKSIKNMDTIQRGTVNFFQKKRELEKKMCSLEKEIEKGSKEMKALQTMVQTYSQNPKFGDVKQFQDELDIATHKVQVHQSDLHALNSELQQVEYSLEKLKKRNSYCGNTLKRGDGDKSPSESLNSGSVSQGYGTLSNCSGSDKDNESIDDNTYNPDIETFPVPLIYMKANNDWGDDFDDEDSVPPPPPQSEGVQRCVSLYPFEGDSECSISMTEGEEFIVAEKDHGGWIKVRRVDNRFFKDIGEGFVPTAFVKFL